jgi:hypothetical protein
VSPKEPRNSWRRAAISGRRSAICRTSSEDSRWPAGGTVERPIGIGVSGLAVVVVVCRALVRCVRATGPGLVALPPAANAGAAGASARQAARASGTSRRTRASVTRRACPDKREPIAGLRRRRLASLEALEVWMRHDRSLNVGHNLVVVAMAMPRRQLGMVATSLAVSTGAALARRQTCRRC